MSDESFEAYHEMIDGFRKDPVLFVEKVFKAKPTKQQEGILRALAKENARVSVRSGCGVGKTTTAAWAILWHTCLFPNCKGAVTAPTKHQLEDALVAETKLWLNRMNPWFRDQLECTTKRLFVKGAEECQFATFKTSSKDRPEALQGLHGDYVLVVVDEASGVDDNVFMPLKGVTGRFGTRVLLMANPTRTTGYFHLTHNRLKHLWQTFSMSCLDSPNVSKEYIKEIADEYGEDSDMYRVRVLGQFPSASICQLIPRDVAEKAATLKLRPEMYNFAPVVVGVDVAWEGDDRSCIVVRQGLAVLKVMPLRNVDNMTLGGLVVQCEDEFNADATFIDVGWGTGVIDYLRGIGRNPVPVNFGGKSISPEYINKRSEMWCELAKWLSASGGALPIEQTDLIEDLVGPEYYFAPNGKKGLESKKDMKRRGLRSPDLGDALALTFAAPVAKRGQGRPGVAPRNGGTAKAVTEYEMFK